MNVAEQSLHFVLQNAEPEPLPIGAPVAMFGDYSVRLASASENGRWPAIGLVSQSVAQGFRSLIVDVGFVTLDNWKMIAGAQHLQSGAAYFLAAERGQLTTNPPEIGAIVCQVIGWAVSQHVLQLRVMSPILY